MPRSANRLFVPLSACLAVLATACVAPLHAQYSPNLPLQQEICDLVYGLSARYAIPLPVEAFCR